MLTILTNKRKNINKIRIGRWFLYFIFYWSLTQLSHLGIDTIHFSSLVIKHSFVTLEQVTVEGTLVHKPMGFATVMCPIPSPPASPPSEIMLYMIFINPEKPGKCFAKQHVFFDICELSLLIKASIRSWLRKEALGITMHFNRVWWCTPLVSALGG